MQIRERSTTRTVILLRSHYDPKKKRSVANQVAKFSKIDTIEKVLSEVSSVLETEEIEQLKKWFEDRSQKAELSDRRLCLSTLEYALKNINDALDDPNARDSIKLTQKRVDGIHDQLDKLRRKLNKHGYKRRKSTPAPRPPAKKKGA